MGNEFDPVEFGRVLGRLDAQDAQLRALFKQNEVMQNTLNTLVRQDEQRTGAKKLFLYAMTFFGFVIGIGFQYAMQLLSHSSSVTN